MNKTHHPCKTSKAWRQVAITTEWNNSYPVGEPVAVYPTLDKDDPPFITKTRGPAWTLGEHTAVVQVEGRAGCHALDAITPLCKMPNVPTLKSTPNN